MDLQELKDAYISSKRNAWAPSTLASEQARLEVLPSINVSPGVLWASLSHLRPYSRTTTWTRLVDFFDYLNILGVLKTNSLRAWRKENARQFKHVYERRLPTISFDEARARISNISDERVRTKALQLLQSGLRLREYDCSGSGRVVGKGGKPRNTVTFDQEKVWVSDYTFRHELRKIGLRPHDLRKLAATKLYQSGFKEADLCAFMGWSSFNTASSYIKAQDNLIEKATEVLWK